jgi:glycosyltransferase involved in cell wall biosynthesis
MRLLFIIDHLSSGGAQRQLVTLAVKLVEQGHKVQLLYYYDSEFQLERAVSGGVACRKVASGSRLQRLFLIRDEIRCMDPEVILAYLTGASVQAVIARFLSGVKCPVIVSERNQIAGTKLRLRLDVASLVYFFADAVVLNAHHVRLEFEKRYPWLRRSLKTIWNGVDLADFSPSYESNSVGEDQLTLLGIGALYPVKGQMDLARALLLLYKKHGVAAKVLWLCRRPLNLSDEEANFKNEVAEFLNQNGIDNCWEWMEERADVRPVLASCAALVHPSSRDGLPNVICEALACGVAVVAPAALENLRLVQHGVNGFLYEAGSIEDFAKKLVCLSQRSDEEMRKMKESAREFAVENLSINKVAEEYSSLFEDSLRCGTKDK